MKSTLEGQKEMQQLEKSDASDLKAIPNIKELRRQAIKSVQIYLESVPIDWDVIKAGYDYHISQEPPGEIGSPERIEFETRTRWFEKSIEQERFMYHGSAHSVAAAIIVDFGLHDYTLDFAVALDAALRLGKEHGLASLDSDRQHNWNLLQKRFHNIVG